MAECQGLVADVVATHGRLDVLVNNAGVTKSLGFFDVTEADWDRIYSVNARGLFFLMQAAAVAMRDQGGGGRIVNIASIAGKGYRGTSNVAYAGTKGAVIAMTRISASQLARYGINVNVICPGVTRTEPVRAGHRRAGRAHRRHARGGRGARRRARSRCGGRTTRPTSPTSPSTWPSDAARNVTGQSWNVDGGLLWD